MSGKAEEFRQFFVHLLGKLMHGAGRIAESSGVKPRDFSHAVAMPLVDMAFIPLAVEFGDEKAREMIIEMVNGSALRTAKPEGTA